ncbi:odorant receptor 23a-like [Drosophila takahashii]|uniref:odorant receptor 23a-like n=1 Tax=Drosophila takahashii TaxID=29030 RepID=UPI001CF90AD8|nr:odorant receptor 23a-like [Drosophila takahashii]
MKLSKNFKIDYFRNQLVAWRICGALHLSEGNYKSWTSALCIFIFLPVPMLMMVLFSFDDPLENNFNLSLAIVSMANLLKYSLYVTQLSKLDGIQTLIGQLDDRVSGKDQILRHESMTKHMQRMSKLVLISYAFVLVSAAVPFIFESGRTLPLPMWFPFEWKNSIIAYTGALTFQEIGMFFHVLQNYPGDSFPPITLFLVSEQCQLLIQRISSIGYRSRNLKNNERDLVNCIRDQNTLYSLLDLTQSMISYPMMVQFLVTGINMAVILFGLIFYVEHLSDRAYYVCILFALMVQTYPLCYYGTVVQESFADLHYAVFCSNWVDQSATYRGYMLIIGERTKRQQLLLAGNLVPIHLSTFVACLKGAYSFFTLMADRDGQ